MRRISLCRQGQENNDLFNYQFLNKLPRELWVLISEADMQDKQVLGARAYSFAAHYQKLSNDAAAAAAAVSLDDPEDKPVLAAVSSQRQGLCRPQHLVRKLSSPGWFNAVASGQLIHMLDQNSKRRFLVDTGPATASGHINLPSQPRVRSCSGDLVHLRFQG